MNVTPSEVTVAAETATANLLMPLAIRGARLRNRIVLSPMCQFSSQDGFANNWHCVHLGSRALGGAALVFTEATAVVPAGRISPADLGLWKDKHMEPLRRVVDSIVEGGAVPGIQLSHAGRKGSKTLPWPRGHQSLSPEDGGWPTVAPSPLPIEGGLTPVELSLQDINEVVGAFEAAARRAVAVGFQVIEVHAAHGYLLHQFLSPYSNQRRDEYGGALDNRLRLLLRVVERVRTCMPERMPLFVRISATDWITDEPSWDVEQSIELARRLKAAGVDVIDVSSGGLSTKQKITVGPGYQVPFAQRIRAEANIMTGAVGLVTQSQQANEIVLRGDADLVFVGRAFLRNPYWGLIAHEELGGDVPWPNQYGHVLRRVARA